MLIAIVSKRAPIHQLLRLSSLSLTGFITCCFPSAVALSTSLARFLSARLLSSLFSFPSHHLSGPGELISQSADPLCGLPPPSAPPKMVTRASTSHTLLLNLESLSLNFSFTNRPEVFPSSYFSPDKKRLLVH